MNTATTKKPETGDEPEKVVPDDAPEEVCTKPFAAESARDEDEDGPCKDGSG